MLTFYNPDHALHHGRHEMFRGQWVPCVEVPARQDLVLAELQKRRMGPLRLPLTAPSDALSAVHAPGYLAFLKSAWSDWLALDPANAQRDVLPSVWPGPGGRRDIEPANFSARLGQFAMDAGSPLTAGTWAAARAGADCAVSAALAVLQGQRAAFALTRPPGHHASAASFGGYCFLNNAAIAVQQLRRGGFDRVAVVDVDYHHGNGTQDIFYQRADVLVASIHGDPMTEYPFFSGHADERGADAGLGCNLNIPLPAGTGFEAWLGALQQALAAVKDFAAQAMVVSLGVDTYAGDPISGFKLESSDYLQIGQALAGAGLPTVFVFEGGYAVAEVGLNTVNVLAGFQSAA